MRHQGLYSSSVGSVFMPTSSLNNDSLKMLCPLLPTHPHQSVRAAYPKYYSNPLTLACVSCVITGLADKTGARFLCMCDCVFTGSPVFMLACISLHAFFFWAATEHLCRHECTCGFACVCMSVSICICVCFCQPQLCYIYQLVFPEWSESVRKRRCQILYKCSSHTHLMTAHFHN